MSAASQGGVTPTVPIGVDLAPGGLTALNITAATVIKARPGRLVKIVVVVAGSAAGTVNDCLTTGAVAASNEVASIPNTIGPLSLDWPCLTGIVVVPGTGQTVAVLYY